MCATLRPSQTAVFGLVFSPGRLRIVRCLKPKMPTLMSRSFYCLLMKIPSNIYYRVSSQVLLLLTSWSRQTSHLYRINRTTLLVIYFINLLLEKNLFYTERKKNLFRRRFLFHFWQLNQLGSPPCKWRLPSDDIKVILLYHKSKRNHFSSFFSKDLLLAVKIMLRWKPWVKKESSELKKSWIRFELFFRHENKIFAAENKAEKGWSKFPQKRFVGVLVHQKKKFIFHKTHLCCIFFRAALKVKSSKNNEDVSKTASDEV